jgi:hypothetical protein
VSRGGLTLAFIKIFVSARLAGEILMKKNQSWWFLGHKALLISFSIFLIIGCNPPSQEVQVLKDLELGAYKNDDGDIIIDFGMQLDLGNMNLPSIEFNIRHPETHVDLGYVSLLSGFDGTNEISAGVNLTGASGGKVVSGDATLPNGRQIPVGGIDYSKVINFQVENTTVRVYLGIAEGMALVGVAVPIVQFSDIGDSIGSVNIFPMFDIKGVKGIAGLFTGDGQNANGLAIFFDFSSVINPGDLTKLWKKDHLEIKSMALVARDIQGAPAFKKARRKSSMYFYPSATSGRKTFQAKLKLNRLHRRRTLLTVR